MEELIEKARNGDSIAYTEIVRIFEKDLYRIAFTRLKNDDDIFDAIQNTLMNVYKNIKKLKNVQYFKTWMIKILLNECNKIYRNNIKNNLIVEKASEMTIEYIENGDIATFKEFNDLILKLSSEEQLIFTLYYKDNYSCEEISKITKINKNTIKSKLDRGREKIKESLKEDYENVN